MKLIKMLPQIHEESAITSGIVNAMQETADKLRKIYDDFGKNEMFAHSAKETICLWEKLCGIPGMKEKDLTLRRSAVLSILRQGGTCTADKIKNIALSYECGDIEIDEIYAEYKIKIRFISEIGIPARINEFKEVIKKTVPAHIQTEYEFKYRRWEEYSHKKWAELSKYTWEEIKNMEEII